MATVRATMHVVDLFGIPDKRTVYLAVTIIGFPVVSESHRNNEVTNVR